MTQSILSWLSVTMLTLTNAIGQNIENSDLSISFQKTTSIVFPFSIMSVDRGSQDVIAQKARGVENVLQVKAARRDFPETNITVITSDGVLHEFSVTYNELPSTQTVSIAGATGPESLLLSSDRINSRDLRFVSEKALSQKKAGNVRRERNEGMVLTLQDLFIQNDILLCRMQIRNKTSINFDIKSLKFFIQDRKKVKRTSSQEIDLIPVYAQDNADDIKGHGRRTMVYALRKFTIPDGKTLWINLFEENGGRHLSLKVKNEDLLKARTLPVSEKLLSIN